MRRGVRPSGKGRCCELHMQAEACTPVGFIGVRTSVRMSEALTKGKSHRRMMS